MDWTGGVRRRFAAGKNNAVLQKQRAHFAKVRAAQQNSRSSQRSFKPNFLTERPRSKRSDGHQRESGDQQQLGQAKQEGASQSLKAHSHSRRPVNGSVKRHNNDDTHPPRSGRRVNEQRSSSVVTISSGIHSSSTTSIDPRDDAKEVQRQLRQRSAHTSTMDEEERLLLAKRRRLLARTDWLGLTLLRPINMGFPASREKDRVGKRRKVKSSTSRKGRPAEQRIETPLFRRQCSPRDTAISGASQPDDIQIKIGTDALMSQTQPSRQSYKSGQTSARQPSTEFAPLSEESMLLGPDEDAFQSKLLYEPQLGTPEPRQPDDRSLVAIAGSQVTHGQNIIPEVAEMRSLYDQQTHDSRLNHDQYMLPNALPMNSPEIQESGYAQDIHPIEQPQDSQNEALGHVYDRFAFHSGAEYHAQVSPEPRMLNMQTEEHVAENETWRRLLRMKQPSSTHHSVAALKSSSMHVTTSESDQHRGVDQKPMAQAVNAGHSDILPERRLETSVVAGAPSTLANGSLSSHAPITQSPSASLRQITTLAEQPAIQSRQAQQDTQDEALWRQFIIGSQDSSDDTSQPPKHTYDIDNAEHIELTQASSGPSVSGLGTSAKSTVGDTVFVNTDTSSRSEETFKRKRGLSLERTEADAPAADISKPWRTHKPAPIEEEDDIEEVQLPTRRTGQANIHTRTTSILNHKRFKAPAKKTGPPDHKPNRFRASKRTKSFTETERSVYDLVDSDGISLA